MLVMRCVANNVIRATSEGLADLSIMRDTAGPSPCVGLRDQRLMQYEWGSRTDRRASFSQLRVGKD